jgi:hypothetical protein
VVDAADDDVVDVVVDVVDDADNGEIGSDDNKPKDAGLTGSDARGD